MTGNYRSFAKINLHLQVVGRRADGYHELRTVFQSVELHDLLHLERTDGGVDLAVVEGEAPGGTANLAARAAQAFLGRWAPDAGVRIRLHKRIPAGGGLGGGSSNAATVLTALQDLFAAPAPSAELWALARELGADVPFFLVQGTALGFGRGDEVVPLPDLPEEPVWIVAPALAVSTAEVFGRLENPGSAPLDPRIAAFLQAAGEGGPQELPGRNDLQERVLEWYPPLGEVYNALFEVGATTARLSGSGACFFAFFESERPPLRLLDQRLPPGTLVLETRTLSRAGALQRRIVR